VGTLVTWCNSLLKIKQSHKALLALNEALRKERLQWKAESCSETVPEPVTQNQNSMKEK
jgi:hypothetical protein